MRRETNAKAGTRAPRRGVEQRVYAGWRHGGRWADAACGEGVDCGNRGDGCHGNERQGVNGDAVTGSERGRNASNGSGGINGGSGGDRTNGANVGDSTNGANVGDGTNGANVGDGTNGGAGRTLAVGN